MERTQLLGALKGSFRESHITRVTAAPPHKSQRTALLSSNLIGLFFAAEGWALGLVGLLFWGLRFAILGVYCPAYR